MEKLKNKKITAVTLICAFFVTIVFTLSLAIGNTTKNGLPSGINVTYANSLINSKLYSTLHHDTSKSQETRFGFAEDGNLIYLEMALSAFYEVEFLVLGESNKTIDMVENTSSLRVYEIKVKNPFSLKLHLSELEKYRHIDQTLADYYGDIWQDLKEGATTALRYNNVEADLSNVKTNSGYSITNLTFLNYNFDGTPSILSTETAEIKNVTPDGLFTKAGTYEFEMAYESRWDCTTHQNESGVLLYQPAPKTIFRIIKSEQEEKNILLPKSRDGSPELFYSMNLSNIAYEETFLNESIRTFVINKRRAKNDMKISILQRGFSDKFATVSGNALMIANPIESKIAIHFANDKPRYTIFSKTNFFDIKQGSRIRLNSNRYGIPNVSSTTVLDEIDFNNFGVYTIEITYKLQYINIATNQAIGEGYECKDIYQFEYSSEGEYSVKYELNGGTNSNGNPSFYNTLETQPIKLSEPTKAGDAFRGWYDNANFSGNPLVEINSTLKHDIFLYAKWE